MTRNVNFVWILRDKVRGICTSSNSATSALARRHFYRCWRLHHLWLLKILILSSEMVNSGIQGANSRVGFYFSNWGSEIYLRVWA